MMEESELKPCWKCGKSGAFVVGAGKYIGYTQIAKPKDTGYVSCFSTDCMPLNEVYTVEEWQSHPRPATREQLVEALKQAKEEFDLMKMCNQLGINGRYILSEIDLLLEGELPAADKEGE